MAAPAAAFAVSSECVALLQLQLPLPRGLLMLQLFELLFVGVGALSLEVLRFPPVVPVPQVLLLLQQMFLKGLPP